jgi:mxaA protein
MKYATRAAVPLLICTAVAAAQTHVSPHAELTIAQTPAPLYAALAVEQTPAPSHAALTVAQTPAPRAANEAVVEQPRLAGYFVGDLLTQRVLLQRDGKPFTPAALPANHRVSAWFERRGTTVATDAALHRWLVVEYQILNAPPKLTDVTLPAWQLAAATGAGGPPATLRIPSVLINIAPLSPPGSPEQVGTRDLRPDRISPAIPIAPIRRALAFSSSAFALTLLAWIAWVVWRNRRAVATQPFARALREMRTLDDREPRAWQAVHRAFDRTAGRVIQSTTLPALFAKAPQLTPMRPQIEAFFQQSSLMFFGGATGTARANAAQDTNTSFGPAIASAATGPSPMVPRSAAVPAEPVSAASGPAASLPHALCAELRRIERRHEP